MLALVNLSFAFKHEYLGTFFLVLWNYFLFDHSYIQNIANILSILIRVSSQYPLFSVTPCSTGKYQLIFHENQKPPLLWSEKITHSSFSIFLANNSKFLDPENGYNLCLPSKLYILWGYRYGWLPLHAQTLVCIKYTVFFCTDEWYNWMNERQILCR